MSGTGNGMARNDIWRPLRNRRSLVVVVLLVVLGYIVYGQLANARSGLVYGEEQQQAGSREKSTSWQADTPTSTTPPKPAWTFDAANDRDNHGLTHEQCDATFPLLYHEIDRAKEYWRRFQGEKSISRDQIDVKWSGDGGLMAMIYNQQLYITHSRGLNHFRHWEERSKATLQAINRAILASKEPIPNIEFAIKINDVINLTPDDQKITIWAFSRNIHDPVMDRVWVIPDFNFWSYPRVAGAFGDFQRQAIEIEQDKFEAKRDQLVWRGTVHFNKEIREPLLAQSMGQPWSDVRELVEDAVDDHRITMPDHCRYKFAVHTEGTTWSGRLKYLLSCHSAIFIHRLNWYTHLYHLLEPSGPNQNYVQAEDDWSDLPDKVNELLTNPGKAQMIADNAVKHFRDLYFTPAAQTCYWRRLFQTWRDISFEPEPWVYTERPDGTKERKVKGMTFDEYVFHQKSVPLLAGE